MSRDQRGKPRGCGGGGGERQGQQPHGPESPTAAVMQALGSALAPMEAKRLRGPAAQGQAGTAPCHLPSCQRGLPQDPCCPAPGPRAAPMGGGGSLTYRPPRVCGTRTGPRMSLIAASPGTWQSRSPWAWAGWHRRMPRPTQHSQQMVKPHRALPPPAKHTEGQAMIKGPLPSPLSWGSPPRTAGTKVFKEGEWCPSLAPPSPANVGSPFYTVPRMGPCLPAVLKLFLR